MLLSDAPPHPAPTPSAPRPGAFVGDGGVHERAAPKPAGPGQASALRGGPGSLERVGRGWTEIDGSGATTRGSSVETTPASPRHLELDAKLSRVQMSVQHFADDLNRQMAEVRERGYVDAVSVLEAVRGDIRRLAEVTLLCGSCSRPVA